MSQIAIERNGLKGLFQVRFNPFRDNRGSLFKYFTPQHFAEIESDIVWRQVIIQRTETKGTIRGIHAQKPPFIESKLLVPLSGQMFWVCVDLRSGSDTFGQWEATVLDADNPVGLYAARGFAHGCCSLSDDCELLILADNDFAEGLGIHYADPDLAIEWPIDGPVTISDAHAQLDSFQLFCDTVGGL